MISVLFNFLFVFNMRIEAKVADEIQRQLTVLEHLYITDFELIMVPSSFGRQKMRLYEDPVIELLCPAEIEDEALRTALLSTGIMGKVDIDYDTNTQHFVIDKDVAEIREMFSGVETLLFLEIPNL